MKVLMFAETLRGLGGIERSSLALARRLAGMPDHSVSLIFGAEGDLSEQWRHACTDVLGLGQVRLPRRQPQRSALRLHRSVRFAQAQDPDVVYCHSMNQLPLARHVARRLHRPIVLHLRTPAPLTNERNRRRLDSVDTAIAVSHATARDWSAAFPRLRDRIAVIHNGIDLARFTPVTRERQVELRRGLDLPANAFVVSYVGRLSPEKGVDDLLLAVAQLPSDPPVATLIVGAATEGGEVHERRLRAIVGSARFMPPRLDVELVYRISDLVVVPSRSEPFGRVVVEAMACGVPVIAAATGGLVEILSPLRPHWLFPPGDVDAIARMIGSAAIGRLEGADPRELRVMAQSFDEIEVANRIADLLRSAADRCPRSTPVTAAMRGR